LYDEEENEMLNSIKNLLQIKQEEKDLSPEKKERRKLRRESAQRLRKRILGGEQVLAYKGNLFERFRGLDQLWDNCQGLSILDVGCCDGLIDYEFARRGADLIHGVDLDPKRIQFAQTLFENVPLHSKFAQADLAIGMQAFDKAFDDSALETYDIVLFLGIHHHLRNQMPRKDLSELVSSLFNKTNQWIAIRTPCMWEIDAIADQLGFESKFHFPELGKVRELKIYKKKSTNATLDKSP
jgi:2-polyprenyl-3-methyl-5-hydroxy-6-metoxy-1,4-benzoquinol methylase